MQSAGSAIVPPSSDNPWSTLRGFRANAAPDRRVEVWIADGTYVVELDATTPRLPAAGGLIFDDGEAWPFGPRRADDAAGAAAAGDGAIMAPMPGRVIAVSVEEGASVGKGQRLVVLEAMKMEQAMLAPFDGTVVELNAAEGAQVAEGTLLVRIEGAA